GSCRYTRARTHPAWPLGGGLGGRLHRRTRERDHVDGPVRVPTSIPGPVVLVHRHGRARPFDVPGVRWRFPDVIRITHIHGSWRDCHPLVLCWTRECCPDGSSRRRPARRRFTVPRTIPCSTCLPSSCKEELF